MSHSVQHPIPSSYLNLKTNVSKNFRNGSSLCANITHFYKYYNYIFVCRQVLNTKEITDLLKENKLLEIQTPNFNISSQKTMSIQNILTTTQPGRFTSVVKGKLVTPNQKFLYLCCDRCHCLTSAEYGSFFKCRSCHINKSATPRYRFSLLVFDETGEMDVTDLPYVLASFKSRLEQMLLKIEIQSKIFNKQDGTAILSYTIHSLECQNITPLPAPANESPVPPSPSGTTYLTTNNINNSIENPTSSPQTLAAYSQSNADAPKSSRGRTLKAKIFP
ncbi:hypothetical protein OROMI_018584 [Orobanche minor]